MLNKKQKQDIKIIVQDFLNHKAFQKREDHVQTLYTIPLLKVLGWDGSNTKVNEEQSIKTRNSPDILLLNDLGSSLFVVESKAPLLKPYGLDGFYTDKGEKTSFVDQLRNYCKAEGVYWGLLTDFIEWRIYSVYPEPKGALYGKKIKICDVEKEIPTITNEAWEMFEKLSCTFLNQENGKISKESVYYPSVEIIRKGFFEKLRTWRKLIRKYLLEKTPIKDMAQANLETQKILDRLIFMKVCFDKNVIPQNLLSAILSSKRSKYNELKKQFVFLNERFDSSLFFHDLCDEVDLSNEITENIANGLNGIDFSGLSVHVIGEVYEDYLGELLAEESKISSEKKNKKSQGIYYTEEYIVDYIVKNTVGARLNEVKSLEEIKSITVLDPACGSGSFLISAFEEFYNKYKELYEKEENQPSDFDIKKEVLLNNLHGVDLDDRAVQIAKLNLLLKALEGTNHIKGRKLLPDLSLNIRCGNSLISGDENDLKKNFTDELKELIRLKKRFKFASEDTEKLYYLKKIKNLEQTVERITNKSLKGFFVNIDGKKPFNYPLKFCEIFDDGGFDVIIGNPPWVSLKGKQKSLVLPRNELNYLFQKYPCDRYRPNLFEMFIWRGLSLLKSNGYFSYIVPDRLCYNRQFLNLRKHILENCCLKKLWFKPYFAGVISDNIIFTLKKVRPSKIGNVMIAEYPSTDFRKIPQGIYKDSSDYSWFIVDEEVLKIFEKIKAKKSVFPLKNIFLTKVGIIAKPNKITRTLQNDKQIKVFKGENIIKFGTIGNYYFEFKRRNLAGGTQDKDKLGKKYKVLLRKTGIDLMATFDSSSTYPEQSVYFVYLEDETEEDKLKFLCGLINSKLMNCFYRNFGITNRDSTPQLKKIDLDKFPVIIPGSQQQDVVKLVDKILDFTKKLNKISDKKSAEYLKILDKIGETDLQLNQHIYQLYGITNQVEVDIIEGNKDPETEFINFMGQFKKLSKKAKIAFAKSISEKEEDLIFEGLDKYREGHVLTAEEEEDIREFMVLTKERPPLPHAKHSA